MRAWIARMTEDNIDQSAIEKAGEILKNGGLAAFPTETVYGLGGNALDAKASEKIYAAKGRPSDNPLIVHIGRMEDLETVAPSTSVRKFAGSSPEAVFSLACLPVQADANSITLANKVIILFINTILVTV